MGFLGYDSDRLCILDRALERACDDLVAAHIGADPTSAYNAVTTGIRAMRTWSQRLRSLIDNPAMTAAALPPPSLHVAFDSIFRLPANAGLQFLPHYGPGTIAADDLSNALLYSRQQQGWSIATDPTPVVALTPDEQSMADAAVAARLRSGDPKALLAGPGGEAIRRQMEAIATDARRSSDFVAALGDEGLTKLADDAARRWHANSGPGGSERTRDRATADLGLLAGVIECGRASKSAPVPAALATSMDPQAAAMLLARLDVEGRVLGELTAAILARWYDGPSQGHPPWIASINADVLVGPGSILFPKVAATPGASSAFVLSGTRLGGDTRIFVLYGSNTEPASYHTIMSTSTDPAYTSLEDAETILETVTGDYPGYGASPTHFDSRADGSVLGDMLAPWLTGIANEVPTKESFTASDRSRLIAEVLRDERSRACIGEALQSITAASYRRVAGATTQAEWDRAFEGFETVTALRSMIAGATNRDDLDKQARNDFNNTFFIANTTNAVSGALSTIPVLGNAVSAVVTVAGSAAEQAVTSIGPILTVQQQAQATDVARNFETYSMLSVAHGAAVARNESQAGTEPPAPPARGTCTQVEYLQLVTDWMLTVPPGPTRTRMGQIIDVGLDRPSAEEHCATVSN